MIVQLSAGFGPEECQIAVGKLYHSLQKEFSDSVIISCKEGRLKDAYHSILFLTEQDLSEKGKLAGIMKNGEKKRNKNISQK